MAPAVTTQATASQANTAIILGFKQYYSDPPKQHLGVDVAYEPGAKLSAPVDGTISFLGRVPGSAGLNVTAVTIEQPNGDLVTLNPFATTVVTKGLAVQKGQLLGTLSATGDPSSMTSHAHLSLRVNGIYRDPSALIAPALDASQMIPAAPTVPVVSPVIPPAVKPAPSGAAETAAAPAALPATHPAMAPVPDRAPALNPAATADPVAGHVSADEPLVDAAAPATAAAVTGDLLALPLGSSLAGAAGAVHVAAPAAPAPLFAQLRAFLLSLNPVLRFGLILSAALLLSALVFGIYQAARRAPELMRTTGDLLSSCLQSAMRGVTMVSRTFLLRTKPSSFGATSPKEVI